MRFSFPSRASLGSSDPFYWSRPRGMGRLGITSNPNAASSPLVNSIATAISQQEGYGAPNSACTSINNPGCLRAGPGQTGTSAQGFAIFPDASTGWSALDSQVQYNINQGVNLQQFFGGGNGYPGYAPSADSNNPTAYANFVASKVGIDTTTPLNQLQATYDSGGNVSIPTVAPIDLSTIPVDSTVITDSWDPSQQTSTDYTPYVIAGVAALALFAMTR